MTTALPADGTTIATAAELYATAGLAPIRVHRGNEGSCSCGVLDCRAVGKHPVRAEWQRRATCDLVQVRREFAGWTGNIGIALQGRHLLVDADGADGIASARELPVLRPTLEAVTGSGGRHWIYRLAVDQDPGTISDRRIAPGLDVKVRGQFVAAPSLHRSGRLYRWTGFVVATLPPELYQRVSRPERPLPPTSPRPPGDPSMASRRLRAWIAAVPPAISGQDGHVATFMVARQIAAYTELPYDEQWLLLLAYNERCVPPWNRYDLRHKLESARSQGRGTRLRDRPRHVLPAWMTVRRG
jgi:hypothetical protein